MHQAARGLWWGSLLAMAAALLSRWLSSPSGELRLVFALPLVGTFLGALVGCGRSLSWLSVARRVDQCYELQDAVATAWQLAEQKRSEPLVQLQIERALSRLEQLSLKNLVRWNVPRAALGGLALWLLAATLGLLPRTSDQVLATIATADVPQPAMNRELAKQLEQSVVLDLEKIAELTGTPAPQVQRLQQLRKQMQLSAERIRDAKLPPRGVLRELSQMEMQLEQARADLAVAQRQQALSAVGKTIAQADELQAIAEAMERKDYEQAAEALRSADPRPQAPEAIPAMQQQLADDAEKVRQAGDRVLADAMESMSEALEQSEIANAQQLAEPLADVLQDQATRVAIQQQLAVQLAAISEAKAMAQDGGKNTAKSDQSRETWGQGDAGDPMTAESSSMPETERKLEQLTGIQGEGPLERRTNRRPVEEAESATVPRRQLPQEYQQAAEDALREEALPLSHRQTIRDYFRSIRSE